MRQNGPILAKTRRKFYEWPQFLFQFDEMCVVLFSSPMKNTVCTMDLAKFIVILSELYIGANLISIEEICAKMHFKHSLRGTKY